MNLKENARQWVLQNLPYDRLDLKVARYLQGRDAHELLTIYHNWMNRLLRPVPRQVYMSRAYRENPIAAKRQAELNNVIEDIKAGRDLRKYLSRGVEYPAQVPSNNRRRDLDLLLNDWGIHHLHFGSTLDSDGYVNRKDDDDLLFAAFTEYKAFLIDIGAHGDWTDPHLIEVIAEEWPDQGLIHELKARPGQRIVGFDRNYTEDERQRLRNVGVNAPLEVNGHFYSPRGGMVMTGMTIDGSREADRLLLTLELFESAVNSRRQDFENLFQQNGLTFPNEPEFVFDIRQDGYGVIEKKTDAWINLGLA